MWYVRIPHRFKAFLIACETPRTRSLLNFGVGLAKQFVGQKQNFLGHFTTIIQAEYACVLCFSKCTNKSRVLQSQIAPFMERLGYWCTCGVRRRDVRQKMQSHNVSVSWMQVHVQGQGARRQTSSTQNLLLKNKNGQSVY